MSDYENKFRRGQIISTYGVGALANFPEDSLIAASLDFWPSETHKDDEKFIIEEASRVNDERLAKRISSELEMEIKYFLSATEEPPIKFRDRNKPQNRFKKPMPFFRFPQIYSCPDCGKLHKLGLTDELKKCDNSEALRSSGENKCNKKRKKKPLTPSRYLVACRNGHLSDFPWYNWVHRNSNCENGGTDENLFIETGGRGYVSIVIKCTKCKKSRSLKGSEEVGALDEYFGGSCPGHKPWMGEITNSSCNESLSLIQRGSTSIYFSNYRTSILIPPYADQINIFLQNKWSLSSKLSISQFLEDNLENHNGDYKLSDRGKKNFKNFFLKSGDISRYDSDLVTNKAIEKYQGIDKQSEETEIISENSFRYQEFETFLSKDHDNRSIEDKQNFDIDTKYSIDDYESWMSNYFDQVVLVKNVQITQALVGFSRLNPDTVSESHNLLSMKEKKWLPGVASTGEGIFIKFNEDNLQKWISNLNYPKINYLKQKISTAKNRGEPIFTDRSEDRISERFLFLHTFSHSLINQISFDSGYPVSQISERLYDSEERETLMAGVFIYTSSGDAEGSLGGLFEKGKPGYLENIIKDAIKNSVICSSDPVCIETPNQGLNGYNGAACHNCCLLPEISCEERNFFLDRKLMVGDSEKEFLGFFNDIALDL